MKTFEEQVDEKRLELKRVQQEYKELLEQCPHTITQPKSDYYSGDYYNVASTDYWDECVCCHARLNKRTKHHSHYG